MANFYVGQRVRLVRPRVQSNFGQTGTIVSFEETHKGDFLLDGECQFYCDCDVEWDKGDGIVAAQHTSQLEPLTPPHEACDDAEFIASLDRLAAKVEEMA